MSVFQRYVAAKQAAVMGNATESLSGDPLNGADAFASQRARLNANFGTENLSGETQTDVELPEGEHGEDPKVTETPEGDDTVAADGQTEVTFDNALVPADDENEDIDEDAVVDSDDLDSVDEDEAEIVKLDSELEMLSESAFAIETYGFNPAVGHVMKAAGLLSGTALESLALETLQFSAPSDAESQLALESVIEKIKEKAGEWSAKIVGFAKGVAGKIMGVLSPLWEKISGMTKTLVNGVWNKTKQLGASMKAHPYTSAVAIVGAIAAVGGIMAYAGGGLPALGAPVETTKAFFTTLGEKISNIKLPFGKVTASQWNNGAGKMIVRVEQTTNTIRAGVGSAASWTQQQLKSFDGQLGRAWRAIQRGVDAIGHRAMRIITGAGTDISKVSKYVAGKAGDAARAGGAKVAEAAGSIKWGVAMREGWRTVTSTVSMLTALVSGVVVRGFGYIVATLRALMTYVKPAATAAA